jgi:hypothetical protein
VGKPRRSSKAGTSKSGGTLSLPRSVWSALGPVPVTVVEGLKDEKGVELYGYWDATNRAIAVRAGLHPTTAMTTCVHEWVHCVIYDAGGLGLSKRQEEQIADLLATSIVADLLSHTP